MTEQRRIWAVVSRYDYEYQIHSFWETEEQAEACAAKVNPRKLSDSWYVDWWWVHSDEFPLRKDA